MLKKLLLFVCLLHFTVRAQNFPAQPDNYVTDQAALLSAGEKQALDEKLKAYEAKTSTQFFIYIANSLNGNDMDQLCQDLFHTWKIGSEKNNGLLIAVFVADHKFRIQTGYGLEGALPDLATKHIQDEVMRPQFKAGNYYAGLDTGVDALMNAVGKEYVAEENTKGIGNVLFVYIFNGIFLLCVLYALRQERAYTPKERKGIIIAALIFALIPIIGTVVLFILIFTTRFGKRINRYSSRWNSDSTTYSTFSDYSGSGGSSSDSSFDSGFDGGGGGDSGGGGSDSSW